ncbi:transcriptional regulator [Streptomyces tateyamensis]|uniref:Transcriptional regulator n=1 Tax=Streptomyces tateyamensis TaxID=565073 RepID=A0A2V4N0J4_9ACTN|nr:transcriptional regulator [Streptomyces tateyamensis]
MPEQDKAAEGSSDEPVKEEPGGSATGEATVAGLSEENAAERVRLERERRGWSTGELAKRMTEAGYPINQSSVWRIESGEPRRRINLNEAIGFAKVFDLSLEDFLGPSTSPEEKIMQELAEHVVQGYRLAAQGAEFTTKALAAAEKYCQDFPHNRKRLRGKIAIGLSFEYRRYAPTPLVQEFLKGGKMPAEPVHTDE